MDRYNKDAGSGCNSGIDTMFGKQRIYLQIISTGPYYAVDLAHNIYWPTPCMNLGGLQVDGDTGNVMKPNGEIIAGLYRYAAGRNAVGIASNSYVSGLSLADCVFSGRRCGRYA